MMQAPVLTGTYSLDNFTPVTGGDYIHCSVATAETSTSGAFVKEVRGISALSETTFNELWDNEYDARYDSL
jgi:hypothetical protein